MKYQDNTLIICPNATKMQILNETMEEELVDLKFMSREEFKNNYFFSYDERALAYLIHKYNYNLDVAKVYLKSLYVIDDAKTYNSSKLNFLRDLKVELLRENLLITHPNFKEYLSKKNLLVLNYYDLDKYEEEALQMKLTVPKATIKTKVVECQTIEEEVNYVCLKILELLEMGVDINKISLTNISSDYHYIIHKLFNYYKIPINLDFKDAIYKTKVVNDYLKTGIIDLENRDKSLINKKLIQVLSSLAYLDPNTYEYHLILIDKLKNTYLPVRKIINAVNIKDLYSSVFASDEYVFVLGFNQDILPKMEKDISYINDSIKDEVSLYKTAYLNKRNKDVLVYLLSNIKNLYLSYKLSTPFSSFSRSSLINDLALEIISPNIDSYTKSDLYNKIRLAEKLDLYHLYGEKDSSLEGLYSHYEIPYNTYSNDYTGIDKDIYQSKISPLILSYTSLNTYNECAFKYYIKYVLKLDKFEDTFPAFIGSMYHKILSLYQYSNFNFLEEYKKYLSKRELSLKEKLLLLRIKDDLVKLIDSLKSQQLLTGYDNALFEKKIDIPIDKEIETIFTGSIDKIMYHKSVEDVYFSIIDYKTGVIDTHIEPMKYGLHMQLPVYLYLINSSRLFNKSRFTGIYYQNILFAYPTWSNKKDPEQVYRENLMLQGYSTNDTELLARFDSTFEKSEYIKGMSYDEDKGFGRYAKVVDDDTIDSLVTYTKNQISTRADSIISGEFPINPKVYDGNNVACSFCTYQDLCYMKKSNQVYLDKVDDLSFLGGDIDAKLD